MKKIVMLNEELGTQMQIYLALCDAYRVEIAENAEAAMYLLRKMRPEILVLDFNLDQVTGNGKSGIDFVKKVKKKYQHLKVMMVLGNGDKAHEAEIQKQGVDIILYKPIKARNLLNNVKRMAPAAAA